MKTYRKKIDRLHTHEIGILLSDIVEFFQQFFQTITDDIFIDQIEKNKMIDSLDEVKAKIDLIKGYIKDI